MNKKVFLMAVLIVLCVLGICGCSSKKEDESSANENSQNVTSDNNVVETIKDVNNANNDEAPSEEQTLDKKIAVVYFSATGTTKKVAEYIKDELKADIFEIVPRQKYSDADLNWNDNNSRTTKEQNDKNSRPEIASDIDVEDYDVIFIGYPIWWGDTPRIIQTFMDSHELSGKTMIPFCTSGGTGISGSENTLKSYSEINWISGKRLTPSQSEVASWVNGLKI